MNGAPTRLRQVKALHFGRSNVFLLIRMQGAVGTVQQSHSRQAQRMLMSVPLYYRTERNRRACSHNLKCLPGCACWGYIHLSQYCSPYPCSSRPCSRILPAIPVRPYFECSTHLIRDTAHLAVLPHDHPKRQCRTVTVYPPQGDFRHFLQNTSSSRSKR